MYKTNIAHLLHLITKKLSVFSCLQKKKIRINIMHGDTYKEKKYTLKIHTFILLQSVIISYYIKIAFQNQ